MIRIHFDCPKCEFSWYRKAKDIGIEVKSLPLPAYYIGTFTITCPRCENMTFINRTYDTKKIPESYENSKFEKYRIDVEA